MVVLPLWWQDNDNFGIFPLYWHVNIRGSLDMLFPLYGYWPGKKSNGFWAFCGLAGANSSANGVLIASHRAEWKLAPENSLAALENAIRYGLDIVETDVRRTKDGSLVILHDPHVGRETNRQGYVAFTTARYCGNISL